ncbi:MAG: DUF4364 family protein [Epulopiscium sp.]|nr:DUF4364 family protein [Candidatus Epulonipiscium sp.]
MFQSTDDLAVNKLIILYLLAKVKMPLSISQITQFVLERSYTDYFSLQQYLAEMAEADLVEQEKDSHISWFSITNKGAETLGFFESRIPNSMRDELDSFIEQNWRTLRNEMEVTADYVCEKDNEYIVHCKVNENDSVLIELKVNVASKKQANDLCKNWRDNATTLYGEILGILAK